MHSNDQNLDDALCHVEESIEKDKDEKLKRLKNLVSALKASENSLAIYNVPDRIAHESIKGILNALGIAIELLEGLVDADEE